MIRFGLLGPVEVVRDGVPVVMGGLQQRAVLAMLLLNAGRVVPITTMVEGLWAGRVPDRAVNTVQVYVSALRRALGSDTTTSPITTHGRGYQLQLGDGELDLTEFLAAAAEGRRLRQRGRITEAAAQLRRGLALWRGPALVEFAELPFTQVEVSALEETRLATLEAAVAMDLERGAPDDTVGELLPLVAAHPLREGLHALLMEAHYRAGRQGDALAAFRRAREVLADELGIDPGPGLQALHRRILAQEDLSTGPPEPGGPHLLLHDGGGTPQAVPLDPRRSPLTIGRRSASDLCLGWDQEVSRLHARLEYGPHGWELVDDGASRNGSYVDGERVSGRQVLLDAQVLRFGATVVVYRTSATATSAVRTYSNITSDGLVRSAAHLSPAELAGLEALDADIPVSEELRRTLHRRFGVSQHPAEQRDAVMLTRARAIRALRPRTR